MQATRLHGVSTREQTVCAPARRNLVVVLVAASAVTAISLGVRSTFGLFLTPMTQALGTNRAGFALAIAIQNLVWGAGQPIAGALADRFGPARVLTVGGAAYAAGVLLMARASSTTGLYLGGGVVVGLGMAAASFAVVLAAVGRLAPPERRTWAMGIATAAGSLGQFALVQLVGRLQGSFGWRDALVVMACVAGAIVLCTYPLRGEARRGQTAGADATPPETLSVTLRRAFRHPPFLLLCAGFFVCGFHVTFIGTHLPAYLTDAGLTRSVATNALALIGLFNVAGSFAAGALGMRHSKARLLSFIYGIRALAIVGLVLAPHTAVSALVFASVMGVLWLGTVPLTSGIVVGQFGVTHAGTLFGFVFFAHQIGAFIGVWFGGRLADAAGSYDPVWWIAVGLGVFGAVVNLFVTETPAPPLPPALDGPAVGVRPAIAGMATVVALAGVGGALALRHDEADASVAAAPATVVCVVHP